MSTEQQTANYLAHYGVMGMKWGKSKGGSSGSSGSSESGAPAKKAKPTSDDIKAARGRQVERSVKLDQAQVDYFFASSEKGRNIAKNKLEKYSDEYQNSGDLELANRRTRGEKISAGVMHGIFATSMALSVATLVSN